MIGLITFGIYSDYNHIRYMFQQIVAWTKERPRTAMLLIISAYVFCLITLVPTLFLHLFAGYLYARATGDTWTGMAIAVPVCFVGTQLGGYCAFFLSRYCLQDYVIKRLRNNERDNPWMSNFFLIDELFADDW